MRKCIALWLVVILLLTGTMAMAEGAEVNLGGRTQEEAYEELIVGSTTMLSGHFFTDMWGNNAADIDVRDLLHAYSMVEWDAGNGMFAIDNSVVSGIAATIDGQGNKTYTIALTDDLYYSDGTQITARDYVFSILLSAAPQVKQIGGMTSGTDYIVGVDAYTAGMAQTISGVRLISDTQLSITVKAERFPFFYELALIKFGPYPIHVIAPGCEVVDVGKGALIRNMDQTIEQPIFTAELLRTTILDNENGYMSHPSVTSGAYILTGFDAQTGIAKFEINPRYKGNSDGQKPVIERLTFKQVQPETMVEQLQNGEVDLLNKCTQYEVVDAGMAVAASGYARASNYMRGGMTMISFNCEQGPMQFENVRKAVALCLDRDRFMDDYVGDNGLEVNGHYGIGQWMTQLVNGMLAVPVDAPTDGSDEATIAAYDAQIAAWGELTLDNLNDYALNPEGAKSLLIEDAWTLNEAGDPFEEGKDAIRCKMVDDELMRLSLTLVAPEGSAAVQILGETLTAYLAEVGVQLTVESMPFTQLLEQYYRQQPRDCDMFYLGTNFVSVYDPTYTYSVKDEHQGPQNTTGLRDEKLMQLAADMRGTDAGDVLTYCQKWVEFQTYWNQVLPAVPIYSNVYYDFYTPRLQNYLVNNHTTWAQAVMYAYLGDAIEEEYVAAAGAHDGGPRSA